MNQSIQNKIKEIKKNKELAQAQESGEKPKRKGFWQVLFGLILLFATKFKAVVFFLLTKAKMLYFLLKVGPALKTLLTMSASVLVYSRYYGMKLAASVCVMILIHEIGHVFCAYLMRIKVTAPIFIPFFGASITMKQKPRSFWEEFVVAYGGPLAGGFVGIVFLVIAFYFTNQKDDYNFYIISAWFTFLINFFNLLPVWNLDGDRMTKAFGIKLWILILLCLGAMNYTFWASSSRLNPMLLIMSLLSIYKVYKNYKSYKKKKRDRIDISSQYNRNDKSMVSIIEEVIDNKNENLVDNGKLTYSAILYFVLFAGLFVGMTYTELLRNTVKIGS